MCGIFGYVGKKAVEPILIEGLRTLEYRGYDSSGVFISGEGVTRAVGAVDSLVAARQRLAATSCGTSGIAHTRWATHGEPTEVNAHPHQDSSGKIFLVHNGIIENYQKLKDDLIKQGHLFYSSTDTEVLAKLIGIHYQGSLLEAVKQSLTLVQGTYGLAVMSEENPNEIVVARLGSPIIIGLGDDGNFVSSDPAPILPYTKNVIYLEDGELAVINSTSYQVMDSFGKDITSVPDTIDWDIEVVKKQGFEHFMAKEMFEAPEVIKNTIRGRLVPDIGRVKLGGLEKHLDKLASLKHLTIVACGSAYYAGYVGKYLLEKYAGLTVDIELASEYRYKTNFNNDESALLVVTQSGETADTLAAVLEGKRLGLLTLGMVNVVGSTIARVTDAGIYNHAGPEVAVASTKAFISEVTAFVLLTLLIGREKIMDANEGRKIIEELNALPKVIKEVLSLAPQIKKLAEKYSKYDNMMYIGRNSSMPVALEGALKLKEVAYIHAEAYAGGELKHGPIALLSNEFPVLALAPQDDVYEKIVSNIEEVKARRSPVLAIGNKNDKNLTKLVDDFIEVPKVHPILQPILLTIPLHLFAYYAGVARGHNVDRPRNLAKSVTVE